MSIALPAEVICIILTNFIHFANDAGKGAVAETKEVVLKVPAGVESGTNLRVRDAGMLFLHSLIIVH
jgi:DnaJ-class molecular chaperone